MLESDVYLYLFSENVGHSVIAGMIAEALMHGNSNGYHGFKVIMTNSGFPAEFRIERVGKHISPDHLPVTPGIVALMDLIHLVPSK